MRLSPRMKNILQKAILQSFGEVPVYLFGSRVDDSLSGGDIDLAVDVELDRETFRQHKVQFKVALLKMCFDSREEKTQWSVITKLKKQRHEGRTLHAFLMCSPKQVRTLHPEQPET